MSNVVFYRDSVDTFECDAKIDGASSNASKVRLTLEFSDRTLLFNGDISGGHVSIQIPKLTEIAEESGEAVLEIIADQTYFEAWTSPFELKNKKSVAIMEVNINNAKSPKVVIENVSKVTKKVAVKKVIKKESGLLKEDCSHNNRKVVSEKFHEFKSLGKTEKRNVLKELKRFTPRPIMESWADSVFNDPETLYAKYCMYELQKGKKKRF